MLAAGDFIDRITSGDLPQLIAILAVLVSVSIVGVVAVITKHLRNVRRDEIAAQLKQDMLNRGMSAEEIKTVLEAGTNSGK